ncbi:MAG: hypothetical protein GXY83_41705 [Rhodopirellula sp.]|nr:hypothetical protein [Rhodopirellula sp.]
MAAKKNATAKKAPKISRQDAVNRVISELTGETTLSELAKAADALVVKSGGDSNLRATTHYAKRALGTAEAMGFVRLTKPTEILVAKVK